MLRFRYGDLVRYAGRLCCVHHARIGTIHGPHYRLTDAATGEYLGLVSETLLTPA